MRLLIPFWITCSVIFIKSVHTHSEYSGNDSRLHGSCMISSNNFNRSCIYDKIVYLARKLPFISKWSMIQLGPLELVRLPNYATSIMPATEEIPNSRSFTDNLISLISKTMEYFLDSYGIKIPLPALSKNFPGIVIEDTTNATFFHEESRHKKKAKRFALIFPLIATFKFILIKALLIPILMGIITIKKMLVMAAMAIPTILTMIRICRFGPGGFFGGGLTAAATTPLLGAPYVTSDTIIGDFSNYAPAAMSAQPYYNNKQQAGDYGGKSLSSFNPFSNLNSF